MIDPKLLDLNGYVCEETAVPNNLIIKHRTDTSKKEFQIEMVEINGNIQFEGLP